MKKIFSILTLSIIVGLNAQVVIGGATGSAGSNTTSVLLDFVTGQNKGIIVPYVRVMSVAGNARTEGTILLDATDPTKARMKFYNGNTLPLTNGWVDLSGQDANLTLPTNYMASQPTILQAPESATSKAIIGAQSSSADGVLVLESSNKAMVLPIVADVQNILSPSPGMMVYVNKTGAKRLAVFNGSKWSFWAP